MRRSLSSENYSLPSSSQTHLINKGEAKKFELPRTSSKKTQSSVASSVKEQLLKEFEKDIDSVRKECFYLKQRLQFLEVKAYSYQEASKEGQESLMKQVEETKIEIAILRKQLEEKQNILKKSIQALHEMPQIQLEIEMKNPVASFLDELKLKIHNYQMECHTDYRKEINRHSDILNYISEFERGYKQPEIEFKSQNSRLEDLLKKHERIIESYERKVRKLKLEKAELSETLKVAKEELEQVKRVNEELRSKDAISKQAGDLNRTLASDKTHDNKNSNVDRSKRQPRVQQDVPSSKQSTISTITAADSYRLFEPVQSKEETISKIHSEKNTPKSEDGFFKSLMNKLQIKKTDFSAEKQSSSQNNASKFGEKAGNSSQDDRHCKPLPKPKMCVNCNIIRGDLGSSAQGEYRKCYGDGSNKGAIPKTYTRDACKKEKQHKTSMASTPSNSTLITSYSTGQRNLLASRIFKSNKETEIEYKKILKHIQSRGY